ncbi:alkylation response protein AidB-like acyl-CoA dehydrogenase [Paenibacillus xylanexedens]|uniref:acyl-CoA dehydrogenase family protein n=1 Tax=Paenibacillus xylanexedens TaxID=528191 RepID=UPI0020A20F41|nr:acyl-CoA dehydrogenase family protein [Paenibacillus xylanexedens]MCP1422265.1 alkylation response protein AidB-like acyl-CoA dehydrogenase [Paenibacillus xylanexedens]
MIEADIEQEIIHEAELFVAREIRPYAQQIQEQQAIPRTLIRAMAEKGYLAASIPVEYGGMGLGPKAYGLLTEVFGKALPAVRSLLTVHTSLVSETLVRFGTPEQKSSWLPKLVKGEWIAAFGLTEPEVGSDAKSVKTEWREESDCYVLNGKKKWITFGHLADVFIIIASNQGRSTAFWVERQFEGVQTQPIEGVMVAGETGIAEIDLHEVRVPKNHIIGRLNEGFEYIVTGALDQGRYSIAWAGLAIAQEALDAMVTYSRKRKQFDQKLSHFQLIRGMIGDAVTKVHAARALCLRAAELREAKDPQAAMETTIAKYFTSKVAVEVASDALQVHGANGISNQYPVARLYKEAKILEIIEGSSQMQQEMISHYGLKAYYKRGGSV